MITFKESAEKPGEFRMFRNRVGTGLLISASSATEAEDQAARILVDCLGIGGVAKAEALATEVDRQKAEVERLKEEIRKMKTETPEPKEFKSRRLLRRW